MSSIFFKFYLSVDQLKVSLISQWLFLSNTLPLSVVSRTFIILPNLMITDSPSSGLILYGQTYSCHYSKTFAFFNIPCPLNRPSSLPLRYHWEFGGLMPMGLVGFSKFSIVDIYESLRDLLFLDYAMNDKMMTGEPHLLVVCCFSMAYH